MSNRQIKSGAIISYIAIFINIAAGLLYTPWMINQIGRADYGLYILMTSILTYFVVDYGLSQSVTRLIAQYRSRDNHDGINNLLGITAKLYIFLDIFVIIALIIIYFFIDSIFITLTAEEIVKFKYIYLIGAFFSILSFPVLYISGVYYAFELFPQIKNFDLISKLGTIFFTILVLSLGQGLYALVLVYAATPFVVNVFKVLYLIKKGYLNIKWKFWDPSMLKSLLNTSLWLLIIIIGEMLLKNISPSILATFAGTEEIAIFSIANTLDNYILVFAAALNGLFLPKISNYLNQSNKEQLIENLMIKVGRFQFILVGFLTLALIFLGKDFIQLWVGDHFAKSYYVLLLLVIPTFLFSILQLGTTYILAINKLKYQAAIYVLAALFNILLALIFTPKYGAIGSGFSIAVSKFIFYILGFSFIFHKKLNINMINFYKQVFSNLFFPLILIIASFLIFDYFTFPEINILSFIINCSVFSLIFVGIIFVFYINSGEKEIVWNLLKRVKNKK